MIINSINQKCAEEHINAAPSCVRRYVNELKERIQYLEKHTPECNICTFVQEVEKIVAEDEIKNK